MAKSGISSPTEGPFTYHVYIGGAENPQLGSLVRDLNSCGISTFSKYDDELQEDVSLTRITEGIDQSQKCLLYITDRYLTDDRFHAAESRMVTSKANRFSKDMIILLIDDLSRPLPDEFADYESLPFSFESYGSEILKRLTDLILKEAEVKLTDLPKENYGYAQALGYYYGYLRIVLPDFKKRLFEQALKNDSSLIDRAVGKMLLIIPESCFCSMSMESPGKIRVDKDRKVVRLTNRAGNILRDYTSTIYRIHDKEKNEEYFFTAELATPLLTMYEVCMYGTVGMTTNRLYIERNAFVFTLKALLNHPDNKDCHNQFRILYWRDTDTSDPTNTDNANIKPLYDVLLPVVKEEIAITNQRPRGKGILGELEHDDGALSESVGRLGIKQTFEHVRVDGSNYGEVHDSFDNDSYQMNRRPRGKCLIINIENFHGNPYLELKRRKGAEADSRNLKRFFSELHFQVDIEEDVTEDELYDLLRDLAVGHEDYDAFVCCILTHGKLGVVYTSDKQPVPILRIADFFSDSKCPSLVGKPKLFFIQACQDVDDDQRPVNSLGPQATSEGTQDGNSMNGQGQAISSVEPVETKLDVDANPYNDTSDVDFPSDFQCSPYVPRSPDFLMSYATLPGSFSYRDIRRGSLYVQALIEELKPGREIDRALKRVTRRVREMLEVRGRMDKVERFQLPFHLTSGMEKLIRF